MKYIVSLLIFLSLFTISCSRKTDLITDLTGTWRICFQDDSHFAGTAYDDSSWPTLQVPSSWEEEGFPGYDGIAWYRKKFSIPAKLVNRDLYLNLGRIHDADEVYINGKFIGSTGNFPPAVARRMNTCRQYRIHGNLVLSTADNVIAVRVYNDGHRGGIISGDISISASPVPLEKYGLSLLIDLAGTWNFKTGADSSRNSPEQNQISWQTITVPDCWESQGYAAYDGTAWYKKEFRISSRDSAKTLLIALGKIDDLDETYLNGVKIGQTGVQPTMRSNRLSYTNWALDRFYSLPSHLINWDSINIITVKVTDFGNYGGIFEGPVGIVCREEYVNYNKRKL